MTDSAETKPSGKAKLVRAILLLLAITSSPSLCCGSYLVLSAWPGVNLGFFEVETRVENRSAETLYITPISTTQPGEPQVIWQIDRIRQIDIPLQPNQSISLSYDAADHVLDGIVVCRKNGECRSAASEWGKPIYLDSFDALPELDPSWSLAIQSSSPYRFGIVAYPVLGLVPVALFVTWLYLVRREKKQAGK